MAADPERKRPAPGGGEGANQDAGRRASLEAISGFVADDPGGDFHKLLNDRVRLGILSSLAVGGRLSFSELKRLLAVSDGNLSVHARKLEDAGYVSCSKSFADRVPRTDYRITRAGRVALERYLKHMEALIRATASKES
ncbi:MAG: transcriptional regulator [Pseudomonadales bacterium]|jgi:DNA-binding HxlR family transcriptional regulator